MAELHVIDDPLVNPDGYVEVSNDEREESRNVLLEIKNLGEGEDLFSDSVMKMVPASETAEHSKSDGSTIDEDHVSTQSLGSTCRKTEGIDVGTINKTETEIHVSSDITGDIVLCSNEIDGSIVATNFAEDDKQTINGNNMEVVTDSMLHKTFAEANSDKHVTLDLPSTLQASIETKEQKEESSLELDVEYRNQDSDTSSSSSSSSSEESDNEEHSKHEIALSYDEDEGENENKLKISDKKKPKGPHEIRTKGEIYPEDLPPLEDLKITVDSSVNMVAVGKVTSIVGVLVIIQANLDVPPLNTDTILFTEGPAVFERIFEVFGPVSSPWYSVRFNSEDDMNSKGVKVGMEIFCAPSHKDYTSYVFVEHLKRLKGSDASWKDDNEPPTQHLDFSDDEEERMMKKGKKNKNKIEEEKEEEDDGDVLPGAIKRSKFKNHSDFNRDDHNSGLRKQTGHFQESRNFNPFGSRAGRGGNTNVQSSGFHGFRGHGNKRRGQGNNPHGGRGRHFRPPRPELELDNSRNNNQNMWYGGPPVSAPMLTDSRLIQNQDNSHDCMNGSSHMQMLQPFTNNMELNSMGVGAIRGCNPMNFTNANPTSSFYNQGTQGLPCRPVGSSSNLYQAARGYAPAHQHRPNPGFSWHRPQRPVFGGNPQFYHPPK